MLQCPQRRAEAQGALHELVVVDLALGPAGGGFPQMNVPDSARLPRHHPIRHRPAVQRDGRKSTVARRISKARVVLSQRWSHNPVDGIAVQAPPPATGIGSRCDPAAVGGPLARLSGIGWGTGKISSVMAPAPRMPALMPVSTGRREGLVRQGQERLPAGDAE